VNVATATAPRAPDGGTGSSPSSTSIEMAAGGRPQPLR
jgi:hypothetical protein